MPKKRYTPEEIVAKLRQVDVLKHGDALLAGLLRCRRCGRKLTLRYSGAKHHIPRYSCSRGWMDNGEPRCIAFGGLRVDDAIEDALLTVVGCEEQIRSDQPIVSG
jgi:hypothetical protein